MDYYYHSIPLVKIGEEGVPPTLPDFTTPQGEDPLAPSSLTPSVSQDKPLRGVSERMRALEPSRKRKIDPSLAIGLKAGGVPMTKIAKIMGVDNGSISNAITNHPGGRELLKQLREDLKLLKMKKANQIEGRLWERLSKEIDHGEAKDVDAMARAVHALEKVQVSASGEAQKLDVTGIPTPTTDVKILIQTLLNDSN